MARIRKVPSVDFVLGKLACAGVSEELLASTLDLAADFRPVKSQLAGPDREKSLRLVRRLASYVDGAAASFDALGCANAIRHTLSEIRALVFRLDDQVRAVHVSRAVLAAASRSDLFATTIPEAALLLRKIVRDRCPMGKDAELTYRELAVLLVEWRPRAGHGGWVPYKKWPNAEKWLRKAALRVSKKSRITPRSQLAPFLWGNVKRGTKSEKFGSTKRA